MMIVGGLDVHRKQITFDDVDSDTGEVRSGQICPATRKVLRAWLGKHCPGNRASAHESSRNRCRRN
jgi:transposase